MAAFRRCVLAVAGAGGNPLASEWSQQLLDDTRNVADDDLLDQDDVWTATHQAFPDVLNFGTPLRKDIVELMERLADAISESESQYIHGA
ncbi:MAG: hypothetical protein ACKO14_04995 [Armatimonadota bacterium]